jgi:hypothetical protein
LTVSMEFIFSSRFKATDRFVDRILDLVVVEDEDHQPCLVSDFRTFSKDVQVSVDVIIGDMRTRARLSLF